jgi:hypothetical protein
MMIWITLPSFDHESQNLKVPTALIDEKMRAIFDSIRTDLSSHRKIDNRTSVGAGIIAEGIWKDAMDLCNDFSNYDSQS